MGVVVKELFFKIEPPGAPENRRKISVKEPEFILVMYNVSNSSNREMWRLECQGKTDELYSTSGDSVQAK